MCLFEVLKNIFFILFNNEKITISYNFDLSFRVSIW